MGVGLSHCFKNTKVSCPCLKKFMKVMFFLLSENLANFIWRIVLQWNYFERDTVGKQLVRSVDSISANIAESHGRFHYQDKKNFGYFARGSLEETKSWIRKCRERKLMSDEELAQIETYLNELGPKLNALINTFKKH